MGIFNRKSQTAKLLDRIGELESAVSGMGTGLQTGGFYNYKTGAGGVSDKSTGFFYYPTLIYNAAELEIMYNESWSCAKLIDIPVDDMLIRWREFDDIDDPDAEKIREIEKQLKVRARLGMAMKAGKLYGTSFLIMVTKEAPLAMPLNVDRLREGDLNNLLVVSRYDCSIIERDRDVLSPTFGDPTLIRVNLQDHTPITVHASRMIRFDGVRPITSNRWGGVYERDWGMSCVIHAINAITQEDSTSKGINHLIQECSVEHIGVDGFEDALTEAPDAEYTLEERATKVSRLKSIYKTVFHDKNDSVARLDVTFAGIADLMDRYSRRLAAIADIPMTRFWGTSPVGMNSTGEGDMINYVTKVASDQENTLRPALDRLDEVLMRCAGLAERPAYHFPSLLDISEETQATIADRKVTMAVNAVAGGVMDENEARKIMTGDPLIGDLSDDFIPPEPELPDLNIDPDEGDPEENLKQRPEGEEGPTDAE